MAGIEKKIAAVAAQGSLGWLVGTGGIVDTVVGIGMAKLVKRRPVAGAEGTRKRLAVEQCMWVGCSSELMKELMHLRLYL